MYIIRIVIYLLLFSFAITSAFSKDKKPKAEDLVKIELFTDHSRVIPGSTFLLGVKFTIEKDWHTYWINPGDAGLPTQVELELPNGWIAADLIFPVPNKIKFGEFANYGYEKEVLHVLPITVAPNADTGNVKINALVKFLVCKEECLTGSKKLSFAINISHQHEINTGLMPHFGQFPSMLPLKEHSVNARASITGDILKLELSGQELKSNKNLTFFPLDEGFMVNGAEQKMEKAENSTIFVLELDHYREGNPDRLKGLIVSDRGILDGLPNKAIYIDITFENK